MRGPGSIWERIGDISKYAVPAYALGLTIREDTWEGTMQFAQVYGATLLATEGMKHFIDAPRPNSMDNKSFPSGHTSEAFSGATFIHARYGLRQAAVPYLLATITAYSRVDSEFHYVHDVVAGAALAGLFAFMFTDRYKLPFTVSADTQGAMVNFSAKF